MSQAPNPQHNLVQNPTHLSKTTHSGASEVASLSASPVGYGDFLLEIKTQIRQRQYRALHAANSELLALYWWLGENISQRQVARGWGKSVVENLARDLQAEFPGRNGFSARNLWNMRDFYRVYADKPKLQPLVAEISWAKNLVIMARCKDDLEREFYLRATDGANRPYKGHFSRYGCSFTLTQNA